MSTYLIGDIHGCYDELISLLKKIKFSPNSDNLWLTGDLVARGSNSLEVLRYVKSLGKSVRIVLGNHDLYLLNFLSKNNHDKLKYKLKNRLIPLLKSSDSNELLNWLRCQPLLQIDEDKKLIMVHAGIIPQWDIQTAKQCASDVEILLKGDSYFPVLNAMHSNITNQWHPNLSKLDRLCFIINVFTRMRFCFPNGKLNMSYKDVPENTPSPLQPWFTIPGPIKKEYNIVFGHWASIKGKGTPKGIYALDTGCCWGGVLTCLRWEDKSYFVQPAVKELYIGKKNDLLF